VFNIKEEMPMKKTIALIQALIVVILVLPLVFLLLLAEGYRENCQ